MLGVPVATGSVRRQCCRTGTISLEPKNTKTYNGTQGYVQLTPLLSRKKNLLSHTSPHPTHFDTSGKTIQTQCAVHATGQEHTMVAGDCWQLVISCQPLTHNR